MSHVAAADAARTAADSRPVTAVWPKPGLGVLFMCAVSFALYTTVWPAAPVREPDSGSYLRAAQDLSDLKLDQLQERPPGYPVLLLVSGSSSAPSRALFEVSLLIHFIGIWLLAGTMNLVGLSYRWQMLCATILLLPPYVEPAAYVLSENFATLAIVMAFAGVVHWLASGSRTSLVTAGVAVSVAALTRPAYQFLPAVLIAYLLAAHLLRWIRPDPPRLRAAVLVLTCIPTLLVGGYAFYNFKHFGHFVLTPKLGLTLSTKTYGFVERLPDEHALIRSALIRARNDAVAKGGPRAGTTSVWAAVPDLTRITGLEGIALSNYMLKLNLMLIRRAPLKYFEEVLSAFGAYWLPSSTSLANFDSRVMQMTWAAIHFALMVMFWVTLILIAGAGTAVYLSRADRYFRRPVRHQPLDMFELQLLAYGVAATVVVYTAVVSTVIEVGAPRYRIPTEGLIVFMMLAGVDVWSKLVHLCSAALPTCE